MIKVFQIVAAFMCCLCMCSVAQSQILSKESFVLDPNLRQDEPIPGLISNSITDITFLNGVMWLGAGRGLSKTSDSGLTFESFNRQHGIGRGGVSAIAQRDDIIWVATGFDSVNSIGNFQTGGGLAYSNNFGLNWNFVPQPGPTPISNITFDIALRDDEVWTASFGGGLKKSTDLGQTWETVAPDSFIFNPNSRLNHRVFSVINTDGVLWVGTAKGINRSSDGGANWTNFSHDSTRFNQTISGNFVVCLARQQFGNQDNIWAGTRPTTVESGDDTEFLGVSFSGDQGFTWKTTLSGETVHNINFDGAIVYAASNNGLWKSSDFGETWFLFPPATSADGARRILSNKVFDVYASPDQKLWLGTGNGLAFTDNNGASWKIVQSFPPTGRDGEARTYAYPNPFSPNAHNVLNGDGFVRFQYNTLNDTKITLKIYDFALKYVTTVVENESRIGNSDLYEIWNGRDKQGRIVHNGVYFYRLELEGDGEFWDKLIVLK